MRQLSTLLTFLLLTCALALNAQNTNPPAKGNKGKSRDKATMDAKNVNGVDLPYIA